MAQSHFEVELKNVDDQKLTMTKRLEMDAEQILRDNELEVGTAEMAPKQGERHVGDVPLVTNLHGMMLNAKVFVYRYDVIIDGISKGNAKHFELTKKGPGDFLTIDRRERCRELFSILKKPGKLLAESRSIYYDLQSILFSLDELPLSADGSLRTNVKEDELPSSLSRFSYCDVTIRMVKQDFKLCIGDLSGISRNLEMVVNSLEQFLNIATSQYAMFTPEEHVTFDASTSFMIYPQGYGFTDDDLETFDENKAYLAAGTQKAVRFIEGPKGTGNRVASVLVQTKKTPFHSCCPLIDKVIPLAPNIAAFREDDRVKLEKFLIGIFVNASYSELHQNFRIDGISKTTAQNQSFEYEGKSVSVAQYFNDKHQIKLQYPTAPLVMTGRDIKVRYFPIELCTICDNQRVKTEQMTPSMTQRSIRKCAVPPMKLLKQNEFSGNSLHLFDNNNAYLSSADIKVLERPIEVKASSIANPVMQFAGNRQEQVRAGSWKGHGYLFPSECERWAVFAFLNDRDRKGFNQKELGDFMSQFVGECQKRGMHIKECNYLGVHDESYKTVSEQFRLCFEEKYQFALIVHADVGDVHADIKAAEREHSVISQTIRLQTLRNVVRNNKWQTLQNIVNKANIKLGGLNYSIALTGMPAKDVLRDDTLYIGFSSNNPGGGFGPETQGVSTGKTDGDKNVYPAPTVVGFSANIGRNGAFDFIGDFVFQEQMRNEKIDVISKVVGQCVIYFQEARNSMPERVVIYRDGCGEGQFKMVLKYEVPLIKLGFQRAGCSALLTIIVVNKRQNIRFFSSNARPADKVPDQNVQPGTVVDHTVVHPEFAEFFLTSHRALQGTARTPKYTVLYDESSMKLSQLESMAYHLCYGHQIVFMPTSLPSPVYIAMRYAERGRMLYKKWIEHRGSRSDDYIQLTNRLSFFANDVLGFYRVNA